MNSDLKSAKVNSPRTILYNPGHKRTQKDIEILMRSTSCIKFFQDITEREQSNKVHLSCCKVLTCAEFNPLEYVFKKGDPGDSLFFILKGQVRILVPKDRKTLEQRDDQLKKYLYNRKLAPHVEISTTQRSVSTKPAEIEILPPIIQPKIKEASDAVELSLNLLETEELEPVNGMVEISRIGPGNAFGEMALINDKPRNASIQCLEHTVLAVLSKEDYQIAGSIHEKAVNEKIDLLRSLPQFSNWTKISLFKLCYYFKTVNYKRGQYVFKEGSHVNEVYVIKEGEFKYTKKYPLEVSAPFNLNDMIPGSPLAFNSFNRIKRPKIYRMKELQIVIKQRGEMFGFEEIIQGKDLRDHTCTCTTNNGELLIISEKDFNKKVVHPETLKYLEESSQIFSE